MVQSRPPLLMSPNGAEYRIFHAHPVLLAERLAYPAQYRDYTMRHKKASSIEHGAMYVVHLPPEKRLVTANLLTLRDELAELNRNEHFTHGNGQVAMQRLQVEAITIRHLESQVDSNNRAVRIHVSLWSHLKEPQYAGSISQLEHDVALSPPMKLAMGKMESKFTKADEEVRKALVVQLANYPKAKIEVYRWRGHH